MARSPTILIVDDDPSIRRTMEAILVKAGMRTLMASSGEEALKKLLGASADLVLLDVQMPGLGGLDVLRIVHDKHPDVGVIMCSVLKDLPVVVEAMQSGALDYITKDFSPGELTARVRKTLDQLNVGRELVQLREEVRAQGDKPMLGNSAKMRAVAMLADKIAAKPITVLITGESGTGKEVLARYLHAHSDRAAGPFVAVNLPAIPAELIESKLFGHEKGSFTGAVRQEFGKFELANGGTLFLDEIGELKLDVQTKLLRALQEHEIERVGGNRPVQLDLRIICATNRDLNKRVQDGQFREDLYWRLKVVPIEVPPLRERREDVRELAQHFLARYSARHGRPLQTLAEEAALVLEQHTWPGNIRELENLMERMSVVCESHVIEESDLPLDLSVSAGLSKEAEREANLAAALAAFEKGFLRKILALNQRNRRRTAEQLGIGYSTLKAKLKTYGIGSDTDDE
jgi:DNA-binding NtrC family response regulator